MFTGNSPSIATKIAQAIKAINKDAQFELSDIDNITWKDGTTPISKEDISAKQTELQAEYDSNEYQRSRATEYPTWQDQLDDIFHNGIDGWKATIQVTKDKYPKG